MNKCLEFVEALRRLCIDYRKRGYCKGCDFVQNDDKCAFRTPPEDWDFEIIKQGINKIYYGTSFVSANCLCCGKELNLSDLSEGKAICVNCRGKAIDSIKKEKE